MAAAALRRAGALRATRLAARAAAAFAMAAACAAQGSASAEPRIVTLAPHATELVYAAGGGGFIVGTVSSSDFPEPARALPRVGDGMILNPERLILLQPTLILAWQRFGAAVQAETLAGKLGVQMAYSAPAALRDIPAEVRRLGHLVGTAREADRAAHAMQARIDALEARYASRAPVTVFIEVGSLPLYTIGGDPLLNDAMRVCGAVNIYATSPIPAPKVPIESVLVHDPQLIVAPARDERSDSALAVQRRWAGYGLPAALRGQVHAADPDALFRPGPRFIDATEALCAAVDAARQDTLQPATTGR